MLRFETQPSTLAHYPAQEVSVTRGYKNVSVSVRDPQTNTGSVLILTPDQARELAAELTTLANEIGD